MYDTEKSIELVKKRMHEYHCRQERRTVCRLSVLCALLFLSLVGAMGIMQSQPINATGMYGTILLHEGAGGYVLAGEDTRSSVPGVFAAGDIRKKPLRQIVCAVSDGAVAAGAAQQALL